MIAKLGKKNLIILIFLFISLTILKSALITFLSPFVFYTLFLYLLYTSNRIPDERVYLKILLLGIINIFLEMVIAFHYLSNFFDNLYKFLSTGNVSSDIENLLNFLDEELSHKLLLFPITLSIPLTIYIFNNHIKFKSSLDKLLFLSIFSFLSVIVSFLSYEARILREMFLISLGLFFISLLFRKYLEEETLLGVSIFTSIIMAFFIFIYFKGYLI